jgi:hypothetical protein
MFRKISSAGKSDVGMFFHFPAAEATDFTCFHLPGAKIIFR